MNVDDFENNLLAIKEKVNNLKEAGNPIECKTCAGLIHAKSIYGIWMDLFLFITNICSTAMIASKSDDYSTIHSMEGYLEDVNDILDNDLISDNIPDLFKVGLEKYLPGYISRMNGVECLQLIHSKVLQIKGKA